MEVLFICVNYRSGASAVRYLRSLAGLRGGNGSLRVVVVDNSPEVDDLALPDEVLRSQVRVLRPGVNLGYFGGAAFGLRAALEEGGLPEACVVSNVDLAIEQPDFLEALRKAIEPGVGVVATSIRSRLTGVDQNPYMRSRPSRARMWAYTWLLASFPLAAAYERLARLWKRGRQRLPSPGPAGDPCDIYAPHGSFIVLTREFLDRGGTIEYPVFLFNEEIHIAEQARALSLRVCYRPELRVFHDEHVSVGRYQSRQMVAHARAAAVYCFDRYFRRGA